MTTKDEALKRIAELHTQWALKHGDTVPNTPDGDSEWNADMNAPPETLDELNRATRAILDEVDEA